MSRLLIIFFVFPGVISAQPSRTVGVQSVEVSGARILGLGGAGTALRAEVWGANPAQKAEVEDRRISLYGDQGFGLTELRTGALRLVQPTRFGTVGAGAETFGFDAFRETALQIGIGRSLRPGTTRVIQAGLMARYHHVAIEGYGSGGALALDAGLLMELLHGFDVGVRTSNVNAGQIAGREGLPRVLAFGIAYHAVPRLLIAADAVKDTRHRTAVRAGMEAEVVPVLALRAGAGTTPQHVSAGFGLRLGALEADLAATRHEALGWSPAVSLGVRW